MIYDLTFLFLPLVSNASKMQMNNNNNILNQKKLVTRMLEVQTYVTNTNDHFHLSY